MALNELANASPSLKLHKTYQALPPSLRAKPAAISPDSPAFLELVGGSGIVDPTLKDRYVVSACYELNMPAAGRAQCILRLVRLQNHIRNELETGKGFSASVKDTINRMRHLLLGTLKRETNPACRASLLITSADIMDETAAIVRRHVPKKPTKESAYALHMANTFNENIRKNCEDDGIDTTALIKRSKNIKATHWTKPEPEEFRGMVFLFKVQGNRIASGDIFAIVMATYSLVILFLLFRCFTHNGSAWLLPLLRKGLHLYWFLIGINVVFETVKDSCSPPSWMSDYSSPPLPSGLVTALATAFVWILFGAMLYTGTQLCEFRNARQAIRGKQSENES